MHLSLQGTLQQTPSTQLPLPQSLLQAQACPRSVAFPEEPPHAIMPGLPPVPGPLSGLVEASRWPPVPPLPEPGLLAGLQPLANASAKPSTKSHPPIRLTRIRDPPENVNYNLEDLD